MHVLKTPKASQGYTPPQLPPIHAPLDGLQVVCRELLRQGTGAGGSWVYLADVVGNAQTGAGGSLGAPGTDVVQGSGAEALVLKLNSSPHEVGTPSTLSTRITTLLASPHQCFRGCI